MSNGLNRSAEKESSWRRHVSQQSASGVSIRSYCRRHGLSEPLFHFWRREIANRDLEACSSSRPGTAGLIAVEIVDETSPPSTVRQTMEIECRGGPVIRLREDVSAEVLHRVMATCQQVCRAEVVSAPGQERSC